MNPKGAIRRGPLAWMAANSVAANLLMMVVMIGGLLTALSLKQEVFPEFELDVIRVTVPYPGASPEEVEQGIVLAVEEAVRGLDGVKRVTSASSEGMASITIQLLLGADSDRALSDITNEVNRIQTLPEDTEEPTISATAPRQRVISLVLSGEQDLRTLHDLAEMAREELLASPDVTQVDVAGVPPLEVAIEIRREDLEAYGLTLEQVAAQIRFASIDLPGGGVDTASGEVLVRLVDRRLRAEDFSDIIIRGTARGHQLRLDEIGTIIDGFEDIDEFTQHNGVPAVQLTVYRVGDETPTQVASATKAYAEHLRARLPASVSVAAWSDDSEILADRIDLLLKNALMGLALVLIVLTLFLSRSLAGWVSLGIPISFLGAFLLMGPMDVSINMITLFAFIITLGLVVDDAIIVAENVHQKSQEGLGRLDAAIEGAREMSMPVTFSVLTTMVAFTPLLFVPGVMGKIFRFIPTVVIGVLFFSLIESFFVLPAHLAHLAHVRGKPWKLFRVVTAPVDRTQTWVSARLERFIQETYHPLLKTLLEYRYLTLAGALAVLFVTVGSVAGGLVPFSFFPQLEADLVVASARLPFGAPVERTLQVRDQLQSALDRAIEQSGGDEAVRGVMSLVGQRPAQQGPVPVDGARGSHLTSVEVNLVPPDDRNFLTSDFVERWRAEIGIIPDVEALRISSAGGPSAGAAVDIQLSHADEDVLAEASRALADRLRKFPALINVDNSYAAGKPQLDFRLRPEATGLGLTSTDVARAIRSAFFGAEALREQRGRNEVKVMVRLPEEQRASEQDIHDLIVPTPNGAVPLTYAADFSRTRSATRITREDGRRTVNVTADLAPGIASNQAIVRELDRVMFPELLAEYPGLSSDLVGQQREMTESFGALGPMYALALIVMFGMLAIPFRSYIQPLVVLGAVPFGVVGAVFGHFIMGYQLSRISVMGIIALSGVVVNDSLVLVDAVNRYRQAGMPLREAIVQGSARRLRPILLTSLTTFFGLLPTEARGRTVAPLPIPCVSAGQNR